MVQNYVVYSREQLACLFDRQLDMLVRGGADHGLIGRLRSCREDVISEAISTAYPEGHLPFAPRIGPFGRVAYVHDLPPAPVGLLSAADRTVALAKSVSAGPSVKTATVSSPVEAGLVLLRRLALEAYGRPAAGSPPAATISIYA